MHGIYGSASLEACIPLEISAFGPDLPHNSHHQACGSATRPTTPFEPGPPSSLILFMADTAPPKPVPRPQRKPARRPAPPRKPRTIENTRPTPPVAGERAATAATKVVIDAPSAPEVPAQEAGDEAPQDSKPKRAPKRKGKGTKAAKAERDATHLAIVLEAARTAVATFAKAGVHCATFGSLACRLYGSARCPKDVDLLVYHPPIEGEPWTAERLKKALLDLDPVHFYLTMPKDPTAEYRVLWYRQYYLGPGCKVDVLLPGTMHLPNLPPSTATTIEGVPLVPFSLLLIHKLQGWDDHRLAEEDHKRRKMPQDAGDIKRMLGLEEKVGELGAARPWSDRTLFSEEFEELTKRRVKDYCEAHPNHVKRWRVLGFEVPDPPPKPEKEKGNGDEKKAPGEEADDEGGEEAEEDPDEDEDDEDEAKAEVKEEHLVAEMQKAAIKA